MKNSRLLILITLVAITFSACSEKSKTEAQKAGDQIEETANAIGKDFEAQKNQFIAKAENEIEAINIKIDKLDKKLKEGSNDVKAETKKAMEKLKEQKEKLNNDLSDLEDATKENWEQLTAGIEDGFQDLKRGYNSLLEDMKAS